MKDINLKCVNILIGGIKTSHDPDNYWALVPCVWVDGKGQQYILPTFDWEKLRIQTWYLAYIKPPAREGLSATVVLKQPLDRDGNPVTDTPDAEKDNPFDNPLALRQYYTAREIIDLMRGVKEKSILIQSDMRTAATLGAGKGWAGFLLAYEQVKKFRETEELKENHDDQETEE